jgi:hypothetical protein
MKTMITTRRVAVSGIVSCFILFFLHLLLTHPPTGFLDGQVALGGENHEESPEPEGKILVMAKRETEDTDWVMENLPEYGLICPLPHIPN